MDKRDKKEMNRREFLKIVGVSTVASTVAMYGCASGEKSNASEASILGEVPVDKMTYRTSPKGEHVSLLGYGCMRWPLKPAPDSDGNVIDQDAVNELVDYAIAHGVNYFDTSPVYCQGFSERATGVALKRHPRERLLIATKMSNFQNYTRENSIKVSRVSMYSGSRSVSSPFAYGAFTLSGRLSQTFLLELLNLKCGPNPGVHALRFGLFRFRSPLLTKSMFLSLPPAT